MPATSRPQYAQSGDIEIAYRVMGEGPLDLVWVTGFVGHLEAVLEQRDARRFFERLASFSRLIMFDKRGMGMSDRPPGTVKDLVFGSGIEFADRGEHRLKGVPGDWRLYAVEAV